MRETWLDWRLSTRQAFTMFIVQLACVELMTHTQHLWKDGNKAYYFGEHRQRKWKLSFHNIYLCVCVRHGHGLCWSMRKILFANAKWFFLSFSLPSIHLCHSRLLIRNEYSWKCAYLFRCDTVLRLHKCYNGVWRMAGEEANDMVLMLTCNRCLLPFVCQNEARTNTTRERKIYFQFCRWLHDSIIEFTTPNTHYILTTSV